MDCPHCNKAFHPQFNETPAAAGSLSVILYHQKCPACGNPLLEVIIRPSGVTPPPILLNRTLIYPPFKATRAVSEDIPEPYRKNVVEAIQVLPLSPNASALLSRRILQAILSDKAGTKDTDLNKQIDEATNSKGIPSQLTEGLHLVRVIGNVAAHPTVSRSTGQLWDVEVGEAELTLKVVESLLDFYFVQPAQIAKQKEEVNRKLTEAGKKPIP